ncbi:MAG TPA: C-GCAxxG-C-C family protein, partial [Magnetospirillaceae bacterium]|nr:C-GCAxxG-C-C family protein [Magnetospirillaceae bacterium]
MTRADRALVLHASGSNCAQSVLEVFAADLGVDPGQAHRLTACLGAGLGRRQLLCGAISGGALALGAAFGSEDGSDLETKELCYGIVWDYLRRLEESTPSTECRAILGVDISTAEGREKSARLGLAAKMCNPLILK